MINENSEKKIEKYNEGTITCIFGERKKKMNENTPEKRLTYPNELFEGTFVDEKSF